jgi:hypothetical protein
MSELNKLVDWLAETATENIDRAYEILGAKPGPGIDIEVLPAAKIVSHQWLLLPLTKAGRAFVNKFWADPHLETNKELGMFKRQAEEWGLKYRVIVKFEPIREEMP